MEYWEEEIAQEQRLEKAMRAFSRQAISDAKTGLASLGLRGKQELLRQAKSAKAKARIQERIGWEGVVPNNMKSKVWKQAGVPAGTGVIIPGYLVVLSRGNSRGHKGGNTRTAPNALDKVYAAINNRYDYFAGEVTKIYADAIIKGLMKEQ